MGSETIADRQLAYRPDIDGLRALAVLSVVLFHARIDAFSGGFVGVDVFFVISGYLITRIILKKGELSREFFKWFYERRIRRLLPPAVTVILFSCVFAYVFLPPEALKEYVWSLISFLAFSANWFFLGISGYFDGPAQYKPLLHTWSLSIEEQFYLIFPIIILIFMRINKYIVYILLFFVLFLSFLSSVWLVLSGNGEAAFFNSFGRFWEIAVGSILALGVLPSPHTRPAKDALGLGGLLLIAVGIFLFDAQTPFPGWNALLPTLGAAAIILADGGIVGRLLAARVLVGIGLISYALYLWHWPIFVFIDHYFLHPDMAVLFGGVAVAVVLSILSYWLIERPVRRKEVFRSRRSAYALLVATGIAVVSVGTWALEAGGFPGRFADAAEAYQAKRSEMLREWKKVTMRYECWVDHRVDLAPVVEACTDPNSPSNKVLVTGDSHAAHLLPGLRSSYPDITFKLLAVDSCALTEPHSPRPACTQLIEWIDRLPKGRYERILVSTRGVGAANIDEFLVRIDKLAKLAPVVIFGPIQFYQPNMPTLYPTLVGRKSVPEIVAAFDGALQSGPAVGDKLLRSRLASRPGVTYVSLLDVMCPDNCKHFDKEGWPILVDNSHLSPAASRELVGSLAISLRNVGATAAVR